MNEGSQKKTTVLTGAFQLEANFFPFYLTGWPGGRVEFFSYHKSCKNAVETDLSYTIKKKQSAGMIKLPYCSQDSL